MGTLGRKALGSSRLHEGIEQLRLNQSIPMERAMVGWGFFNIVIVLLQMFLAPYGAQVGVNVGNLNKYFMFSLGAWIMVALLRKMAPLRIPSAMIFLIMVQIWFTVATFMAQIQLGRSREFMSADYSLVTFLLCFIQMAIMSYMFPEIRVLLKRLVVVMCLVSAVVAGLQFLGFGPAIDLANIMVGIGDISNWGGQGGVRATGIFPGVGTQVTYNLIGIGLIASALYERKLNAFEITAIVVMTGTVFMSQVRNALVVAAIVIIPLIILFVKRHKIASLPYIVCGLLVLAGLVVFGGERFNYMFSGDTSTFDYRQDVLWPQARSIYEQRPWFGIGVEPDFTGVNTYSTDRWSDGVIMDNGYLVALSFGGLPALVFLVLSVIAGGIGVMSLLRRKTAPTIERGYAIVAGIIVLFFGYGMYFGNLYTNLSLGMFYFVLAGCAMPSKVQEPVKSMLGSIKSRTEGRLPSQHSPPLPSHE